VSASVSFDNPVLPISPVFPVGAAASFKSLEFKDVISQYLHKGFLCTPELDSSSYWSEEEVSAVSALVSFDNPVLPISPYFPLELLPSSCWSSRTCSPSSTCSEAFFACQS